MELCASVLHKIHNLSDTSEFNDRYATRAACNADKLPKVPPDTKTPPAILVDQPARDAIHFNAWFSACIAPEPPSQLPAKISAAPKTASKLDAAGVGAAATKARLVGWSKGRVDGTITFVNNSKASSHPKPFLVIESPNSLSRRFKFFAPLTGSGPKIILFLAHTNIFSNEELSTENEFLLLSINQLSTQ